MVLAIAAFNDMFSAFRSLKEGLLANGYHVTLLQSALTSDTMTLALPILSALPFTASYIDDIRSGFIKEYLPRTRRRDYIAGKLTACLLSGGCALVLGVLLFYGGSALVFLPLEMVLEEGMEAEPWLGPLLDSCILMFCSGAFWSLVGMTMSAVTGSGYMAYAAPFILYYVMIILCERYFTMLYVCYPREWLNPEEWTGGIWGVVVLLGELSALFAVWFAFTVQRRLSQL